MSKSCFPRFLLGLGSDSPTKKRDKVVVRNGGFAVSIVVFAIGAILRFAVTVNTLQHGFNVHTVGVILMIVGAVGAVLSLVAMMVTGMERHRTVVDDGRGNVVQREDTYS
jgi:hypothetical protein